MDPTEVLEKKKTHSSEFPYSLFQPAYYLEFLTIQTFVDVISFNEVQAVEITDQRYPKKILTQQQHREDYIFRAKRTLCISDPE